MKRFAVMVDAGYLFEQFGRLYSERNSSEKLQRRHLEPKPEDLFKLIIRKSSELSPLELLRVYWYDAARNRVPDKQQESMFLQFGIKVRLGSLYQDNDDEENLRQKAVDSLLVLDLVQLARNKAVADIVLISGDEDMLPGIEEAQQHGIRVMLLSVEDRGVSKAIKQNVDKHVEFKLEELCTSIIVRPPQLLPISTMSTQPNSDLNIITRHQVEASKDQESPDYMLVLQFVNALELIEVKSIIFYYDQSNALQPDVDRRFIHALRKSKDKTQQTNFAPLRKLMIDLCRKRLLATPDSE